MTEATTAQAAGTPGATAPAPAPHRWQFMRAGGVDQVVFRSGEDIARIAELDQKLWVALACPTRGIDFDPRTLDLIDTDRDGIEDFRISGSDTTFIDPDADGDNLTDAWWSDIPIGEAPGVQ